MTQFLLTYLKLEVISVEYFASFEMSFVTEIKAFHCCKCIYALFMTALLFDNIVLRLGSMICMILLFIVFNFSKYYNKYINILN